MNNLRRVPPGGMVRQEKSAQPQHAQAHHAQSHHQPARKRHVQRRRQPGPRRIGRAHVGPRRHSHADKTRQPGSQRARRKRNRDKPGRILPPVDQRQKHRHKHDEHGQHAVLPTQKRPGAVRNVARNFDHFLRTGTLAANPARPHKSIDQRQQARDQHEQKYRFDIHGVTSLLN